MERGEHFMKGTFSTTINGKKVKKAGLLKGSFRFGGKRGLPSIQKAS